MILLNFILNLDKNKPVIIANCEHIENRIIKINTNFHW